MNESNIYDFLKKSLDENLVVSVFSDREQPEKCAVGYVASISDDQVLINHITPTGLYDGYVIRKLEDIFRIDTDGQYEKKMNQLYTLKKQMHEEFIPCKVKHGNLFKAALTASQKSELIVNFCIDETEVQDSMIGFVKEVNDNEVVINQVTEYGVDDCHSVVLLDDIIKLNCDSVDEHM